MSGAVVIFGYKKNAMINQDAVRLLDHFFAQPSFFTANQAAFIRNAEEYALLKRQFHEGPVTGNPAFQRHFARFYGMRFVPAAGKPTPVDWDNEFVLAIVDPFTNIQIELAPESLQCENGQLVFTYSETVGEKQSFWIIPDLLLKVDRKYEADSVRFVRQQKKTPGSAASEE